MSSRTAQEPSGAHATSGRTEEPGRAEDGFGAGQPLLGRDASAPGAYKGGRELHPAREFGGPWGTFAIMLFSHFILYYFWASLDLNRGDLLTPEGGEGWWGMTRRVLDHIRTHAAPTRPALLWYSGFLLANALFSAYLPGVHVKGLPLSDGTRLDYNCNGLLAWYFNLAGAAALHWTGVVPLQAPVRMLGPLLTVSCIAGNAAALLTWAAAYATGRVNRPTGSFWYDIFMGVYLNPRLLGGRLDLKMWAETRVSWYFLFLITLSAAAEQWATTGRVTGAMAIMLLAHALYANACAKGEECIPTTWDIFYENWGWMLAFWNLCGVPILYAAQSVYILRRDVEHALWYDVALACLLVAAYYVWDTANSQKNRFRMARAGTLIERRAFPQLPWGTLTNAKTIETAAGSPLLIDGWWAYARKPHYTADLVMAFCWGAACGFSSFLPWFYFLFFLAVLVHRAVRDVERCAAKYGADWDRYCAAVPYTFVPGVF